ncbi:MAG: hypothetical protein HY806_02200 [Nitrospirae bacterium]|nr:hypothetical protein [Nitrospirota bacterium]MBI4837958.1 hypothetical protein [Nitrospirota bacterium]
MSLWTVAIIIFLINIPFGYWRANTRKFSLQWFAAIHAPIPFVIAFRILGHLGWQFITFPVLIGAFFFGQLLGGKLHKWGTAHTHSAITSCIFCDIATCFLRNIKTNAQR